ncbi:MAG: DNA polymerase III subunit psi [Aeromonas sobria]
MQDPVRQSMLTRMGIQSWQLRRPALLGAATAPELEQHAAQPGQTTTASSAPLPTGKLWLLAPRLPPTALLADICQLLGVTPDEVSLLSELPPADLPLAGQPPLLWLTEANPARPDALICPLVPSTAQKRALWQQLRQYLAHPAA